MKNDIDRIVNITIALLILLSGLTFATEITAWVFRYSKAFGQPITGTHYWYNPLDFILWLMKFWRAGIRHHFVPGLIVMFTSVGFVIYRIIQFNLKEQRANEPPVTHGSARFATDEEVKTANLINNRDPLSVYIGALQMGNKLQYLRDSKPTHIFAYAPSRSGKGVGLIVPTLLTYQGSTIVSDFKLENWSLTAGARRAMGHIVIKFDPTCQDDTGAHYNPLIEIRPGLSEVRDTQLIADMLVDQGESSKKKNTHWDNSANSFLVSVILHVLYVEEEKSISGVRNFISNPKRTETDTLLILLNAIHDPNQTQKWNDCEGKPTMTHPVVAYGAREMLNKSEPERTGIFSTALTALKLYRDPVVAHNTGNHDFSIDSLVNLDKPVSLYLGIPPSDIERTMPLMRLILQQILSRLTEKLVSQDGIAKRRQLLLMLDEFPQFGKLPFFEKALAYAAGYNIRAYLISQDLQQLYKEYGKEQSITSNCGIRIAFTPNTLETAKQLSEHIGIATFKNSRWVYGGKRLNVFLDKATLLNEEIKRSLMTPDELLTLDSRLALIFQNGLNPIMGRKIIYYQDPFFKNSSAILPPEISDKLPTEIKWTFVFKEIENADSLKNIAETHEEKDSLLPETTEVKAATQISTAKYSSSGTLESLFKNWLVTHHKKSPFIFNTPDSIIHKVSDGALLVLPKIVELFIAESSFYINKKTSLSETIEKTTQMLINQNVFSERTRYFMGAWEEGIKVNGVIVAINLVPDLEKQELSSIVERDVT